MLYTLCGGISTEKLKFSISKEFLSLLSLDPLHFSNILVLCDFESPDSRKNLSSTNFYPLDYPENSWTLSFLHRSRRFFISLLS